jgi:hypothetical protein
MTITVFNAAEALDLSIHILEPFTLKMTSFPLQRHPSTYSLCHFTNQIKQ